MVRILNSRSIASILLFCAAVQASPAARLALRQDSSTTSSTSSAVSSTPTDSAASSTGTDASATPASTSNTDSSTSVPGPSIITSGSVSSSSTSSSTATTPSAWISVNETNGQISTIVPIVTTSDGVTRTLNLPDPSATGNATNGGPEAFLPTCDSSKFEDDGLYKPFCLPHNGSVLYLGQTYYVTWDTSLFGANDSVEIITNFVDNATLPNVNPGPAFDSNVIPNKYGFISFFVDPAKFADGRNFTWYLNVIPVNGKNQLFTGPTVMGMKYVPPPVNTSTPPVSKLGIAVGIPVALIIILVIVFGVICFNRDKRRIGNITIPGMLGRRHQGYGTRRAKSQRIANRPPNYRDDVDARAAEWEMGNMKTQGPYQDNEGR